jgi:hypothetical protein
LRNPTLRHKGKARRELRLHQPQVAARHQPLSSHRRRSAPHDRTAQIAIAVVISLNGGWTADPERNKLGRGLGYGAMTRWLSRYAENVGPDRLFGRNYPQGDSWS